MILSAEVKRVSTSCSRFVNYSGPLPTFVIVSGAFGSPPLGGVSSFGNYGKCPLLQNLDFENVGAAARAINAAVCVVHLTDATASRLPRADLERGVETLAGALGAEVIRAATPSAAAMARIARRRPQPTIWQPSRPCRMIGWMPLFASSSARAAATSRSTRDRKLSGGWPPPPAQRFQARTR